MPEPATLEAEIAVAHAALERSAPLSSDEELIRIGRLVNRADDAGFTEAARSMLSRDAAHVQPLSNFLFGVFMRYGPPALPPLLGVWHRALTTAWSRVQPADDRARAAVGALRWMLRTMVQRVDFHHRMEDPVFVSWKGSAFYGAETLEVSSALREAINERLEGNELALGLLAELDERVRQHFSRRRPAPEPTPLGTLPPVAAPPELADEAEGETASGEHVAVPDEASPLDATVTSAAQPAPTPGRPAGITLQVSPAMAALVRKIEAFAALLERDDLERAAIIAQDLEGLLQAFDPRLYFPRLLGGHFQRLAGVIEEMQARDVQQSPLKRAALAHLYHTDLARFLEP